MSDMDRAGSNSIEELFGAEFAKELNSLLEQEPEKNSAQAPAAQPSEPPQKGDTEEETVQSLFLGYLHDITVILSVLLLIFPLLFRVVQVNGTSMNKTLYNGDYLLLLSSTFYNNPKRGDVIVASKQSFDNGKPIIKRVIATEHQIVDIDFKQGIVTVDGVVLDEPYILEPTHIYEGVNFPLVVPDGCLFVMGDNRNDSKDSRSPQIGMIDTREVVGKVLLLFLPGTNMAGSTLGLMPFDISRIGVID